MRIPKYVVFCGLLVAFVLGHVIVRYEQLKAASKDNAVGKSHAEPIGNERLA